ncbi:prolyl oligopeptidase family serine peptidase [Sphingomonas aerophila]|uniref:Prolyl oligopeptidase n=1 Tax=Sphingomonas aerophila TaxID=1344948 RepID=A0A7W9BB39_9SPHN|nr:prolyl oligopeptidase family serine peptidase [Sphingomonas aerophila]MBB5713913.1 prolyl oligopeptidase [Sphingomonas aerophila]
MRLRALFLATAFLAQPLVSTSAHAQMTAMNTSNDPYIWLEDKDGAKPLAWVEAENARTLPRLQNDPRFATYQAEALAIAAAKDRIPMPNQLFGRIYNFWRDADHPHGIFRWTTEAGYAAAEPAWTVALDIDALGKAEGKTWVFKGLTCLQPEERLCLVALSEGGEDAVTYREFDLQASEFVADGFTLPTSKQDATWIDKDTLLVSRDWGQGTMTQSGYPFVVKMVKRGQPLEKATEVFRGETGDQVSTGANVVVDAKGNRLVYITRGRTFFGNDKLIWTPAGVKPTTLPQRTRIAGLVDGQVVFQTSEDWGGIPQGSVASMPLADFVAGRGTPTLAFRPNARQSVEGASTTRTKLLVSTLDNVRGRFTVFSHGPKGWTSRPVMLPDNAAIDLASVTDRSDKGFISVNGFLDPTSLWTLDAASATVAKVRTLPAKFDASRAVVEQFEATSTDGTKIPYFIVHRRDVPLDGTTPTIMTAYGGFELSRTPTYLGSTGKIWVERGGSFVLANIRGGGEFGPAWHEAGRKTKRQIIYDDFAAVAKDLSARKLTSPAKLGIYGGSNGGLLMGVEFNQHPDLWRAVSIGVPLLDMLRYEQIAAGYSWVDEYGSVKNPDEAAFLAKISPYNNLKRGVAYPEPYIWTTTKDDRVGPQHARKFAARMKEFGLPYLFYEDTAGGHSGDADIAQGAKLAALQMVYFSQKLMDAPSGAGAVTAAR